MVPEIGSNTVITALRLGGAVKIKQLARPAYSVRVNGRVLGTLSLGALGEVLDTVGHGDIGDIYATFDIWKRAYAKTKCACPICHSVREWIALPSDMPYPPEDRNLLKLHVVTDTSDKYGPLDSSVLCYTECGGPYGSLSSSLGTALCGRPINGPEGPSTPFPYRVWVLCVRVLSLDVCIEYP